MITTSLPLRGILGGFGLLLASCASDPLDTTRVPMSASSSGKHAALADQLHRSLNDWRRSRGEAPLASHDGLQRLAQAHCEFMARNRGKFSLGSENITHYGFEQRSFYAQKRFGMGTVSENVAAGTMRANIIGELTAAWTSSNKHSYNLKQDWDASGLGVYVSDDGMVYATQIFATEAHSNLGMHDAFGHF